MAKAQAAKKQVTEQTTEQAVETNAQVAEGKKVKTLTTAQQAHYDTLTTTSSKIRYLNSLNWARGEIAKFTGKRYQHVRNVLITPLTNAAA